MSMRDQYENLDKYAAYDYKDVSNAYGHGEDDAIDRVLEIIHQKGISNAYDRPSFWYNKGNDYKVIDTKYHRGYDQALADVEEEVLALKEGKG